MLLRFVCVAYLSLLLSGCAAPIVQLDLTPEQMNGIDQLIGENFLTFHADIEPILGEARKTIENDTPTYDFGDKYRFRGLTAAILNDKVVMLSFYANRRLTPHEAIYALGYRELPEFSWIDGRPYICSTQKTANASSLSSNSQAGHLSASSRVHLM